MPCYIKISRGSRRTSVTSFHIFVQSWLHYTLETLAYSVSDLLFPDFIDKIPLFSPENSSILLCDSTTARRLPTVMMHSRAYMLLEREYQECEKAHIFGISVTPAGDNFMEWVAEIRGLKDSLWEGAVLQLAMKYTENYNKVPPSINFTTIPFHPNVDPASGRPCMDFLDDPSKWNTKLTMSSVLLSIQVMLSNPVLDNAVNMEAAKMLKNNISLYRKRVIRCVTTSQRLEAVAGTEHKSASSVRFYVAPKESASEQPRKTRISYEDYYLTWFQIATSRVDGEFKRAVFDDPNFIANQYDWMAENVAKGEWDADIHRLLLSELTEKRKNPTMFSVRGNIPSITPPPSECETPMRNRGQEDYWEKEVKDLVNWSRTLP